MPIIPLLLLALVVFAGLMMFFRGWTGVRIDDHPICRKCGFDLFGLPPGADRCSECGADLNHPRAIRDGQRVRRGGLIMSGLVLMACGGAALALMGWARLSDFDPNPWKPLSWILSDTKPTAAKNTRDVAFAELLRRIKAGELSQQQLDAVADTGLAHQADLTQTWMVQWGDIIEQLRARQTLSDERWKRYARQGVQSTLEVRAKVRRGDSIPVRVVRGPARVASGTNTPRLWVRTHHKSLAVAGVTREQGGSTGTTLNPSGGGSSGWSETLSSDEFARLKDGPQPVRVSLEIEISQYQPTASDPDTAPTIVKFPVELDGTFELVPADVQTVTTVHAPEHSDAVRNAIKVRHVHWSEFEKDRLSLVIDVNAQPVTLAHDVFARDGGREVKIATVTAHPNRGGGTSMGEKFPDLTGERIDVILRPSVAVAHGSVDVFEVWSGELVIPDVKVARYDPTTRKVR